MIEPTSNKEPGVASKSGASKPMKTLDPEHLTIYGNRRLLAIPLLHCRGFCSLGPTYAGSNRQLALLPRLALVFIVNCWLMARTGAVRSGEPFKV